MLIALCIPAMADITCGKGTYLPADETTCARCRGGFFCTGGTFQQESFDQGAQACPPADDTTHRTAFADELFPYDPVTGTYDRSVDIKILKITTQTWSNGWSDISNCLVQYSYGNAASVTWYSEESVAYNVETGKYDIDTIEGIYYGSVRAGYYLDTIFRESYCNAPEKSQLYRRSVICPAGYYCPGGSVPECGTGPQPPEWGRIECPAGSYCPPGADAPTPCPAGTYSGVGASECVPCTNAPENAVYTSGSDADNCPWKCDDGYAKNADTKCAPLCTAGVTRIRTPELSIPLFASPQTTPSIHIRASNGVVCYGALVTGVGGLNIKIGDTIYHAVE